MDQLRIQVFRPVDAPWLAAQFILEHEQVLEDIGVSNMIGHSYPWLNDPKTHLIVAMHDTLGMVAGIRVQPAKPGGILPMEATISSMDKSIHDVIRFLKEGGTAEICSLWNAHRFAGKGVPLVLSQAAVALASQLDLRTMTCFVAHYTMRHARKVGFVAMEGVGNQGVFTYPVPNIRSVAMVIPDIVTLPDAQEASRRTILGLRARPMQSRIEIPATDELHIQYMLHAASTGKDPAVYGSIRDNYERFSA